MAAENLTTSISGLCQSGWRRFLMTGFLRKFLTEHFSVASNLEHLPLVNKLWTSGDATKILIESALTWTPTRAQNRPAILVKAEDASSQRIGIGDRLGVMSDNKTMYAKLMLGSHSIVCLDKEEAMAEILGAEVSRVLMHFAPIFLQTLSLHRFTLESLGAPAVVKEYAPMVAVPVKIAYVWEEAWKVFTQAPPLRTVTLSSLLTPYAP